MASVWTLPVDEITAEDLDAFLKQRIPEGQQLDYKQAVDKSLAKSIASFANTVGGLIILGVATDDSNQPIYPPCGIPASDWKSDSITQVCADGTNPMVLPSVGPTLKNPHDKEGEDTVLVVMRVDQSPLSPHAVDKSTRVPVRVKDITKSIDWADIDRISLLLKQRDKFEALRDDFLNRSLQRLRQISQNPSSNFPIVWYSVTPVFLTRPITNEAACEEFPCEHSMRRAPRGALSRHVEYGKVGVEQRVKQVIINSVESTGAFFRGEHNLLPAKESMYLDIHEIYGTVRKFFGHCQRFLKRDDVLHPGQLRLAIGFENVGGHPILCESQPSQRMPDATYSVEVNLSFEEFKDLDFNEHILPNPVRQLIRDIGHGFGLRLKLEP